MAETRIILGWTFQTRSLRIELPLEKHTNWTEALNNHISMRTIAIEQLDTTIGRLNHVGIILPPTRHFLSRTRSLVSHCQQRNKRWVRLPCTVKEDLHLFKTLLTIALRGVSMNNMVFRIPTHIYRSDASSHGVGGYNLCNGKAWRYRFPSDILSFMTLNTLEFVGCVVTLWIDIIAGETPAESCILSQTDSTSADGWLYKSNFDDPSARAQLIVARKLATIIIQVDCCLYSQWFPGELNVVSDVLSRRFDLTNSALVSFVLQTCAPQVPFGIKLLELPNEISYWLTSLLLTARNLQQSQHKPPRKINAPGAVGQPTSPTWDSVTTCSSRDCLAPNAIESSVPSPKPSAAPDLALPDSISSLLEWSKPPSRTWRRPFGLTTGKTQDSTQTEKWRSFYNANSEDM